MLARSLRKVLLKVEPIFGLRQLVSFKFSQFISSLFQNSLKNKGTVPHRLILSCPQGIFVLVIDQDKAAFKKISWIDNFIVLSSYPLFMGFIYCGSISMLLIKMLQMNEALFKTRSIRNKFYIKFKGRNFSFNNKNRF